MLPGRGAPARWQPHRRRLRPLHLLPRLVIAAFTDSLGRYLAHYRQTGVSLRAPGSPCCRARRRARRAHAPLYLRGLPALPAATAAGAAIGSNGSPSTRGLTYRHPGAGRARGIARDQPAPAARLVHRGDRARRRGQDDAAAGAARAAAARGGRDSAGTAAPWPTPATFFVPPRCAYTPQVPRLFSETLRENILLGLPDEPATWPPPCAVAVLERDCGAGGGAGHAGRPARRQALGRAGPAHGGGAHVRARRRSCW